MEKARYVSGKICKSRWICLVRYGNNSNWHWHAVYLQNVLVKSFCTWGLTCIGGTRPYVNKWKSWRDMANISNYHTFNCVTCTGFWLIYWFSFSVHDCLYIFCPVNQTLDKPGWWINYATQTGNWYKTFSIKPKCIILYMCCMKGIFTYWHKGVKHASSFTKRFLGYLPWNSTKLKRVPHLLT